MSVVIDGSVELRGTERVAIRSDRITATCSVVIKSCTVQLVGQLIISELTPGVGFGLSSTSPEDVKRIVYFDVVED